MTSPSTTPPTEPEQADDVTPDEAAAAPDPEEDYPSPEGSDVGDIGEEDDPDDEPDVSDIEEADDKGTTDGA
jgi:hypothetical protein